jgi:hypothetical protein
LCGQLTLEKEQYLITENNLITARMVKVLEYITAILNFLKNVKYPPRKSLVLS